MGASDKPVLLEGEFWVTNADGVEEHVIGAWSAECAARSVGEERYHESDYPEQQEFQVENWKGEVATYFVFAEPQICFTSRLKTQELPADRQGPT